MVKERRLATYSESQWINGRRLKQEDMPILIHPTTVNILPGFGPVSWFDGRGALRVINCGTDKDTFICIIVYYSDYY